MAFDWRKRLETVSHEPGVYIMRSHRGTIVYIGKAADLHARLRSYFGQGSSDTRLFVSSLEAVLGDIETILVRSAKEALILENHLIKKHQPRFNVRLKDDKNFLQLRLDVTRPYPRLEIVRKRKKDGALYFGPYHSARSIRQTLKLVGRHFRLRNCTDTVFRTRTRPCLQYQIGRCLAPCVLDVAEDDYARRVEDVRLFLSGHGRALAKRLRDQMGAASHQLDFERAARLRDQALAVERSLQEQVIDLGKGEDFDAFGLYREGAEATVQVIRIRKGLLTSSRAYHFEDQPLPSEELLRNFLGRYYEEADIPRTVLLPLGVDDAEVRAEWLSEQRGSKVELRVPQRGRIRELVGLAEKNAAQAFEERRQKEDTRTRVLEGLQKKLNMERLPERIECYDISQFQGSEAVGSRVVFEQGEANKAQYRHYSIRDVEGQNDFAMMYEVLSRRFQPRKGEPDPHPQLLVVDGGLGQLGMAKAVIEDLGVFDVELASLAKSRVIDSERSSAPERSPERVFRPGRKNPIVLHQNSSEIYLLQQLRDEAHRFAITFHRQSRRRRNLASELDNIPGVGPSRRRTLLKHFGSLKRVKTASLGELKEAPGVPDKVAVAVFRAFSA